MAKYQWTYEWYYHVFIDILRLPTLVIVNYWRYVAFRLSYFARIFPFFFLSFSSFTLFVSGQICWWLAGHLLSHSFTPLFSLISSLVDYACEISTSNILLNSIDFIARVSSLSVFIVWVKRIALWLYLFDRI